MSYIQKTTLPFPELVSALPLEDAIDLSHHLASVHEARRWTRDRIEERRKQLNALIAIQNAITPINTLPNELLMKIFGSISIQTWASAPWMLSVGHICRRWRGVVLATPEFWVKPLGHWDANNDYERNDHLLPVFLERSSPCPLQLYEFDLTPGPERYHSWEPHFGRVTVVEASVENKREVPEVLRDVTSKMPRLERLKLELCAYMSERNSALEVDIRQWDADSLSYLGCLEISGDIFCHATTVPSLHTLVLLGRWRAPRSFTRLLDGLKGCPVLAKLQIDFGTWSDILGEWAREGDTAMPVTLRSVIVELPNLRHLRLTGPVSVIRTFLCHISFPVSAALVELVIEEIEHGPTPLPVLPDILPRRLSILYESPTIDRLFLQSGVEYNDSLFVCVRGYVQGAERLRVGPAVRLHTGEKLLHLLEVFAGTCTVTELALDLRYTTSDMNKAFWGGFFATLPGLHRLQLFAYTPKSRKTKRDIAEHFLASSRELHGRTGHTETSLAWVVRADEKNPAHLEEELGDVLRVLRGHARYGGRLGRLELWATSLDPTVCDPRYDALQVVDVAQFPRDGTTKWLPNRHYVSQLAEVADVVTVSRWQLKLALDALRGSGKEDVLRVRGQMGMLTSGSDSKRSARAAMKKYVDDS